jgi:hypothetical protein
MYRERETNVTHRLEASPKREVRGAAMVEAVIVLPVLLSVIFIFMSLALFCFRLLTFQFWVSDLTRETFIYTKEDRKGANWQPYLESQLALRAQEIGLTTRIPNTDSNKYKIQFSRPLAQPCEGWQCGANARPGDIFSITVTVTEPLFSRVLADISWQQISMSAKGIAFVNYRENE